MENRAKYRSAAKIKIDSFDDLFGENPAQSLLISRAGKNDKRIS